MEAGDGFGGALAASDFDGDGRDELAIGVPNDSVSGRSQAGAVHVLRGRPAGLSAVADQLWTLDSRGIKGFAGSGFHFGAALAAGDTSRNGRDELAIGLPGGRMAGRPSAGGVLVLYGRPAGLSSFDQLWSQGRPRHQGDRRARRRARPRARDRRPGSRRRGRRVRRRQRLRPRVGVPGERLNGVGPAGAVNTIHGSHVGLREDPDRIWTQAAAGVLGAPGADSFGAALASGSR